MRTQCADGSQRKSLTFLDPSSFCWRKRCNTLRRLSETSTTTSTRLTAFIQSTRVSRCQKKHSLTYILSFWLLYNIFNYLSSFSTVHSIFLAYLSGLTIFFCDLSPTFLWPASRSYTFHFNIHAFLPTHSHPFLKHAHTILPYVAVSL